MAEEQPTEDSPGEAAAAPGVDVHDAHGPPAEGEGEGEVEAEGESPTATGGGGTGEAPVVSTDTIADTEVAAAPLGEGSGVPAEPVDEEFLQSPASQPTPAVSVAVADEAQGDGSQPEGDGGEVEVETDGEGSRSASPGVAVVLEDAQPIVPAELEVPGEEFSDMRVSRAESVAASPRAQSSAVARTDLVADDEQAVAPAPSGDGPSTSTSPNSAIQEEGAEEAPAQAGGEAGDAAPEVADAAREDSVSLVEAEAPPSPAATGISEPGLTNTVEAAGALADAVAEPAPPTPPTAEPEPEPEPETAAASDAAEDDSLVAAASGQSSAAELAVAAGAVAARVVNMAEQQSSVTPSLTPGGTTPVPATPQAPSDPDTAPGPQHMWFVPQHLSAVFAARAAKTATKGAALSTPRISIKQAEDDMAVLAARRSLPAPERLVIEDTSNIAESLKTLVEGDHWLGALALSTRWLAKAGYEAGTQTEHTVTALQVWLVRSVVLMRLQRFADLRDELDSFGGLDAANLFFRFYPDHCGDDPELCTASLVPFSLRLIRAVLPSCLGNHRETLDRLYGLVFQCQRARGDAEAGFQPGRHAKLEGTASPDAATQLWAAREEQLLYAIGNAYVELEDFALAFETFERILARDPTNCALMSGLGRLALQFGDTRTAKKWFTLLDSTAGHNPSDSLINKAFLAMSRRSYDQAQDTLLKAVKDTALNAVATNNLAVCSLYKGSLKEALSTLQEGVESLPVAFTDLVFNLCTLYELESSSSTERKQALIPTVLGKTTEAFQAHAFKLPVA